METASAAPYEQAYQMEFRGSVREYFKIWMANFLLSVLTVGIYSAWAKVRNRKYLYGSTYLDGANFDYTARPLSILIGRVLIALLIFGGTYWAGENLLRVGAHSFLLVLLLPWALVRSYAFNARFTFYRNVGFSFIKTRRVYIAFYLVYAPLILFTLGQYAVSIYSDVQGWQRKSISSPEVIAFIAFLPALLLLLLPLCMRAAHRLKGRHMCWGKYQAGFAPVGYLSYFAALVLVPLVTVSLAFIPLDAGILMLEEQLNPDIAIVIAAVYLLCLFRLALALVGALLFRMYWQGLVLPDGGKIRCNFSPFAFAVNIVFVNALAIVVSLGLLYPWAQVRKVRYLARHTVLLLPVGALAAMAASNTAKEDAIGDELEAAEGLGFGIDLT